MRFIGSLFQRHRPQDHEAVSEVLDERERELQDHQRRLAQLPHIRRERELYTDRKRRTAG